MRSEATTHSDLAQIAWIKKLTERKKHKQAKHKQALEKGTAVFAIPFLMRSHCKTAPLLVEIRFIQLNTPFFGFNILRILDFNKCLIAIEKVHFDYLKKNQK